MADRGIKQKIYNYDIDKEHSSKHSNPVARLAAAKQWLLSSVVQTCFAGDKDKSKQALQISCLSMVLAARASEGTWHISTCRGGLFIPARDRIGWAEGDLGKCKKCDTDKSLLVQDLKWDFSQNPVPRGRNLRPCATCLGLHASKIVTRRCRSRLLQLLSPGFKYLCNNRSENWTHLGLNSILQKHSPHLVPKYVILCFVLLNFLPLKSVQPSEWFFSLDI